MPVTLPRLPFHLKHTLIRTALKNGAVFEIDYAGAVGAESERRNWWGGAREVVRVTKGKGILLSGGASEQTEIRAPRDAANLITLLGIPQNLSHDAVTQTPKSLVLRAQTRKTYRATLSEPKLIFPQSDVQPSSSEPSQAEDSEPPVPVSEPMTHDTGSSQALQSTTLSPASDLPNANANAAGLLPQQSQEQQGKKRQHEDSQHPSGGGRQGKKKKKQ